MLSPLLLCLLLLQGLCHGYVADVDADVGPEHGHGDASSSASSASSASSSGSAVAAVDDDDGPVFDTGINQNVTVQIGRTAHLHCRVRSLRNRTVSWIRHRDVHILSVGKYVYASDNRFDVVRSWPNDDWTLQIKYSQTRDSGLYECQVSTQPHRSQFINLNVVVPRAVILGGPEVHVDVGSHVNLTCIISHEPPEYIFWYHHDQILGHDSPRGGVAIVTDKSRSETTSSLLLRHARLSDSGKYSCKPSNADPSTINLHVLHGERPAAMQSSTTKPTLALISQSLLLFALLARHLRHAA